jgi:hypothetical protein
MSRVISFFTIVLSFLIALFIFVNLHEIGHTLFARLLGDPQSVYYLVQIEGDHQCFGCNIYDTAKLTWGANLAVAVAGVLFSQAAALALIAGWRRAHPAWLRQALLIGVVVFLFDFPLQVLQAFRPDVAYQTGYTNVDFADFTWLLQAHLGIPLVGSRVILAALCALYLGVVIRWMRRKK